MVTTLQYHDMATIQGVGQNSERVNGIFQKPDDEINDIGIIGRYEPSTRNSEMLITDGSIQKVKGIFFMPLSVSDVSPGLMCTVYGIDGALIVKTKALFFSRGLFNCRLYL